MVTINLCAQTLIKDPGFEEVDLLFDGQDTIYQYKYWKSLLPFKKVSHYGHPIYSKYKTFTKSEKAREAWAPYEGDSQLIPHLLHHRNLYQTKLLKSLEVGQKYRITFKYRILGYMMSKELVLREINNKIGIRLSVSSLYSADNLEKFVTKNFNYPPSISITNYKADSLFKWMEFEYVFIAERKYEYLTVGNFVPIAETAEEAYNPAKGISFRIDLVNLEKVSHNTQVSTYSENIDNSREIQHLDNIDLSLSTLRASSLVDYYSFINTAETNILDNDYVAAIANYFSAFKIEYPFFRDYRNAKTALSKVETKDSLLTKQFAELTKPIQNQINPITKLIDSIFQLDQEIRHMDEGKIGAQDSSNHEFLISILKDTPISEQSIGINCMMHLEIILLHLTRYENFSKLIPLLAEQVAQGNFNNRAFANLIDGYYEYHISSSKINSRYLTQSIYPIFTKFLLPEWSSEDLLVIDNRRYTLGLESLEDQYRKQFYNFKYGYKDFEFYQFFTYFPAEEFCTEEEKDTYLEKEKIMVEELKQQYENLIIWTK